MGNMVMSGSWEALSGKLARGRLLHSKTQSVLRRAGYFGSLGVVVELSVINTKVILPSVTYIFINTLFLYRLRYFCMFLLDFSISH